MISLQTNEPLSDHFTWREVTFSSTAARLGIDNSFSAEVIPAIRNTAKKWRE